VLLIDSTQQIIFHAMQPRRKAPASAGFRYMHPRRGANPLYMYT